MKTNRLTDSSFYSPPRSPHRVWWCALIDQFIRDSFLGVSHRDFMGRPSLTPSALLREDQACLSERAIRRLPERAGRCGPRFLGGDYPIRWRYVNSPALDLRRVLPLSV